MSKELIVKHNKIIESKYNMTLTEVKIIAKLTTMIKKDDKDFKDHTFKSRDLLDEIGIGRTNYSLLEESINKLISRRIEIDQPKEKKLVTTFLSSCLYDNSSGESTITLSYDPKLKPYFLQLKNNFTKYQLENVLDLKSFYAIRIYELLKQYENLKERILTIDELKEILQAKEKSYERYNNFKRKVILKSKEEINEKTDINFEFEEIKTGRKVTSIKFIIKTKRAIKQPNVTKKQTEIQEVFNPEFEEIKKLLPVDPSEDDLKLIKKYYDEKGFDYVISNIKYANKRANKIKYYGFLIGRNGALEKDYAVQERKKEKIQKEKESKKKLKEKEKQEFEEFFEKYVFNIYAELEYFETLEYEQLFNKNKKFYKGQNVNLETFIISQLKSNYMEQIESACEPDNYEDYKGFLNHLVEIGV